MQIKRKKIMKYFILLQCLILLLMPIQVFAAPDGEVGKISKRVTKDNVDEIDTEKDVVFADGAYIYYADAEKLFKALKKDYGDRLIYDENGEQIPWSKQGSWGDGTDAYNFRKEVVFAGDPGTAITSTLQAALTFDEAELSYPIKISETIIGLASALLLAYTLMELQERSQREIKSLEEFWWIMFKMCVGFLIISNNELIIRTINDIGQEFLLAINNLDEFNATNIYRLTTYSLDGNVTNTVTGQVIKYSDSLIEIAQRYDQSNIYASYTNGDSAFLDLLSTGFSGFFQSIANLWLSVMCYALKITFTIRLVLLPIAYADFSTSGIHGKGFSFIKGTLGEAMTVGLIMAMCVLSSKIAVGTGGAALLMLSLSCIGAFNSVKSLAKEAFS